MFPLWRLFSNIYEYSVYFHRIRVNARHNKNPSEWQNGSGSMAWFTLVTQAEAQAKLTKDKTKIYSEVYDISIDINTRISTTGC